MLKQRVITAVVLLAVLFAAIMAASPWPLVVLFCLAGACGLWEWLRLVWPVRGSHAPAVIGTASFVLFVGLAVGWLENPDSLWAQFALHVFVSALVPLAAAAWVVLGPVLVVRGNAQAQPGSIVLSSFGVLAIAAVWFALVQLFLLHGAWFVVSLMALIWCADIAAYFCGKAFGRHKLAPKVSPGKTWEGAVGGVLAAVIWVLFSAGWPGSFGHHLMQSFSMPVVAIIAAFLGAISIVGDLFESLLKRRAGMKDSSQLLPGHGGVYDRIDALLPVAPLAWLITGVFN
jgi:phosphatidate cytidylyltransferase